MTSWSSKRSRSGSSPPGILVHLFCGVAHPSCSMAGVRSVTLLCGAAPDVVDRFPTSHLCGLRALTPAAFRTRGDGPHACAEALYSALAVVVFLGEAVGRVLQGPAVKPALECVRILGESVARPQCPQHKNIPGGCNVLAGALVHAVGTNVVVTACGARMLFASLTLSWELATLSDLDDADAPILDVELPPPAQGPAAPPPQFLAGDPARGLPFGSSPWGSERSRGPSRADL